MQPGLFPVEKSEPGRSVPGLACIPGFIDPSEEETLLRTIDGQSWLGDLKRRVQHYGYRYDYKARSVSRDLYLGPLPDWLASLTDRLYSKRVFPQQPDQAIINEYMPGQGIAPHIDCVPCFTDTVVSLSLGSACVMDFAQVGSKEKISMLLEPRSLLVLSGDARYKWTHAIAPRKSDKIDGAIIPRHRRVSVTFRRVILDS